MDPNLAFMGITVVAIAGLGFAVHAMRLILEELLAAQRAGDEAMKEYRQVWADYEYRLAQYQRARDETEWKHDVRPTKKPERVTLAKKKASTGPIEWTG